MRSLKECYLICKKHHTYWTDDALADYMCVAAAHARIGGDITPEEEDLVCDDAMSLVRAIDECAISLIEALIVRDGNVSGEEVKAYWDKYINNMEIQDG